MLSINIGLNPVSWILFGGVLYNSLQLNIDKGIGGTCA